MMQYFPFSTLLNTRVGPEALAHRVATVFGLKYIPGKRNIIGQEQVSTNKDFEEINHLINNSLSQDIANRVERVLETEKTRTEFEHSDTIEEGSGSNPDRMGGNHCVDKIEIVEETEYDEMIDCSHSYDRRCHISYVTQYLSQEKQVCEENYKRDCIIKLEKAAINETVEVCRKPLVKDCDENGVEVCITEYETECVIIQEYSEVIVVIEYEAVANYHEQVDDDEPDCETVYEELCLDQTNGYTTSEQCNSWPKEVCSVIKRRSRKVKPVQSCNRIPRNICGPESCSIKEGPEECFEKTVTAVKDSPKESCVVEPVKTCKIVTELVPRLEPAEECVDVPREVCSRVVTSPRLVKKPVVKQWCYNIG